MAARMLHSDCLSSQALTRGAFFKGNSAIATSTHSRAKESGKRSNPNACKASAEPLLLRAAKGQAVERPPAWMMRQAGRYMVAYQKLAKRHPSFRERSETESLIVEITLQPWHSFAPDGVILFSDILTPLDAMGIPFEIDDNKGPVLDKTIRTDGDFSSVYDIDLERLSFVSDSLRVLRKEVDGKATLLGFVGAPWTLATYCVEGGTTRTYVNIKSMIYSAPEVLQKLLTFLANQIATYAKFQIEAGAQCIQIFDSWGGQLTPEHWDTWSKPYIQQIISSVKEVYPEVPLVLYANGSGGLLERMGTTGADVIGLDWTLDMADARARLGASQAVQGNVDPAVLFATPEAITDAIHRCIHKAGPSGHVLNLGHGVLPGTPESSVAHFFSTARSLSYADMGLTAAPAPVAVA